MKLPRIKRGDYITVEWVDITSRIDWINTADFEKEDPVPIITRGVFISKDKTCLKLVSTVFKDFEQVGDRHIIPLSVITKIIKDG